MSIVGASKTIIDSAYAFRFIRLMQKSFSEWDAFKTGIIDENGNVLKRPKTDEEKSSYTPFHGAVRALKKNMAKIPGMTTWTSIQGSLSAIGSRFGLSESELTMIESELSLIYEDMVAGDSGGDPVKITSGETSGDIVNAGPQVLGKKKERKIKSLKDLYFDLK